MLDPSEKLWHQVSVVGQQYVGGKGLSLLLQDVLSVGAPSAKLAVLSGVDGAGDPFRGITRLGCVELNLDSLFERLQYVTQLDWANFCFFESVSKKLLRDLCRTLSIEEGIAVSLLSARVIDDSEVHIFTISDELQEYIQSRYTGSRTKTASIDALDFPG